MKTMEIGKLDLTLIEMLVCEKMAQSLRFQMKLQMRRYIRLWMVVRMRVLLGG